MGRKSKLAVSRDLPAALAEYEAFFKIQGQHPLKTICPESVVEYKARYRPGGSLLYFNFELAKEMGLVKSNHAHAITPTLSKAFLEAFSLMIINEYDLQHKTPFAKDTIKQNTFMATRYLQLQHQSKTGKTSGDGRSIWNGEWKHQGTTWDVSSLGTGVTKLSPGSVLAKRPLKNGSTQMSYGCGMVDLEEAMEAALQSEIFYRNGLSTERVLGVIAFKNKTAILIRVAKNLTRPSHLFLHLKQKKLEPLRRFVDFVCERQFTNGAWKRPKNPEDAYDRLLHHVTEDFASMSAHFEDQYIFCWMDWDGDNILLDAGILDYGSVRQFGLFHHQYRYDDVDRYSTTITEQKNKARAIVQTFAQLVDYLKKGKKRPISAFKKHTSLKHFHTVFEQHKNENLLKRMGLSAQQRQSVLEKQLPLLKAFRSIFAQLEKATSQEGPIDTGDGINKNALFCLRDVLRELPKKLYQSGEAFTATEFMAVLRSHYATEKNAPLTSYRRKQIAAFQKKYIELLSALGETKKSSRFLLELTMRSSIVNHDHRVTGNGLIFIVNRLLSMGRRMNPNDFQRAVERFIHYQTWVPGKHTPLRAAARTTSGIRLVRALIRLAEIHRHEI